MVKVGILYPDLIEYIKGLPNFKKARKDYGLHFHSGGVITKETKSYRKHTTLSVLVAHLLYLKDNKGALETLA